MDDALQRYTRAAVDGDRAGATRIVRALEHDGVAPSRIIRELLALSQAEVGLGWQRFRTSVEHERQATSIANAMLSSLHDPAEHQRLSRGRLVMLCAAGDRHELPARMAARLLAQQGWQVTNLGVAEPTTELIDAVMTLEPSIVGVSCALPANLVGAAATVAALNGPQDHVRRFRQAFEQRRNLVVEEMRRVNGLTLSPQGELWATWSDTRTGSPAMYTAHGRARPAP